jgi:hypothetical protein
MMGVAVRRQPARILQIPIIVLTAEVSGLADRGMMIHGTGFVLPVVRCAGIHAASAWFSFRHCTALITAIRECSVALVQVYFGAT